ncbi:MucB/RseB C-terminal domain-containing protein [Pigmentiphaga soli]|uniref:MucB/RseB C-terminal domain-containing protein n=1 Tax=Pigmentiphaga soli TaxID=1007095 RepID=A0ABP8HFI8_9BURK
MKYRAVLEPARTAHFAVAARHILFALACALAAQAQAQTAAHDTPPDPAASVALLQRIQTAAQRLDYTGVFTYQQGPALQSSRVTHMADAKGEYERLEVLDGQPLEFLRNNDEIQCLIPSRRAILVEQRTARDRFPGLMLGSAQQLLGQYDVSVEPEPERVADRDCQVISLDPKDDSRYGYRLCADTDSGLLLRAQTLAPQEEVIEQVAFTSVQIGGIDRKQLKPRWSTAGWKVVRTNLIPTDLAAAGWSVGEPAGFTRITQVQRSMGGKPNVKQVMLSDGLAAISVFIEPFSPSHPQQVGPGPRGAIHVVGRRLGDYWITVLGEVPLATIQQVADSIQYNKPGASQP